MTGRVFGSVKTATQIRPSGVGGQINTFSQSKNLSAFIKQVQSAPGGRQMNHAGSPLADEPDKYDIQLHMTDADKHCKWGSHFFAGGYGDPAWRP